MSILPAVLEVITSIYIVISYIISVHMCNDVYYILGNRCSSEPRFRETKYMRFSDAIKCQMRGWVLQTDRELIEVMNFINPQEYTYKFRALPRGISYEIFKAMLSVLIYFFSSILYILFWILSFDTQLPIFCSTNIPIACLVGAYSFIPILCFNKSLEIQEIVRRSADNIILYDDMADMEAYPEHIVKAYDQTYLKRR